jgi:hypothetical protein
LQNPAISERKPPDSAARKLAPWRRIGHRAAAV